MSETARRLVLLLLLVGMAAVGAELLLLSHHEDWTQAIPLALLAGGAATLSAAVIRPSAGTIRAWRAVACLFLAVGLAGVSLHLQASMEFQREMHPSLSTTALARRAVRAKAPPALAPGALAQLGLLGLLYTFRHPSLKP